MPFRKLDQDRIVGAFGLVVLLELDSQSMALHPDDGIDFRIEVRLAAQCFNTNCVFLQAIRLTTDCLQGNELKERLKSRSITKGIGMDYPMNLVLAVLR